MNRLLRTSAIRLSLRYSMYYMLIAGAGLDVLEHDGSYPGDPCAT